MGRFWPSKNAVANAIRESLDARPQFRVASDEVARLRRRRRERLLDGLRDLGRRPAFGDELQYLDFALGQVGRR